MEYLVDSNTREMSHKGIFVKFQSIYFTKYRLVGVCYSNTLILNNSVVSKRAISMNSCSNPLAEWAQQVPATLATKAL